MPADFSFKIAHFVVVYIIALFVSVLWDFIDSFKYLFMPSSPWAFDVVFVAAVIVAAVRLVAHN